MVEHRATGREEEKILRLYLNDIGRYPLLTRADEMRLGALVQAGLRAAEQMSRDQPAPRERNELKAVVAAGEDAAQEFVRANLRLVVSVAKRYRIPGVSLLDVIQEGNVGLLQAVERFDPKRGFKFSTYATWWIRQTISRGIANTSRTIRLPVHASEQLLAIRLAVLSFEARAGRQATAAEVAQDTGLTVRKVHELLPYLSDPMSLSERATDTDVELVETIGHDASPGAEQVALASMLPAQVRAMMSRLDEREKEVLCLRYGLDRGIPRSLEEVGEHVGLTREGVRLIEAGAMAKLRRASNRGALDLLTA